MSGIPPCYTAGMKIYRESDLECNYLKDKKIAVLGYGNQGHAHSLNLRDSGADVVVGARPGGEGWKKAQDDGFEPLTIREATTGADAVMLLLPDEVQKKVFDENIRDFLKPDASLLFAHGFASAFGEIIPPAGHDVLLVAPKAQGHYIRTLYSSGEGVICLVAVEKNASGRGLEKALSYASLIGCLRAGAIETSFKEEAVTDLFGEQVVLCGGVPELIKAAFETLVENGYQPEIAYIECLHELKIITDIIHRRGISAMRKFISKTAAWGGLATGGQIIPSEIKEKMKVVLESIENASFAETWMSEAKSGGKKLSEFLESESGHPIERAGKEIRKYMPNLKESTR